MKHTEIRKKFFDFFTKRNHEKVASSSLIPAQDPTLLFANAGMNQFKDVFLGNEKRCYTRATSIQKCVRAGGKHNDLDNVGFTKRHLTFFEMMGNFSFGDYFKKEAIEYAWEFLTNDMKLDKEKLHVSVYQDDDESYDLWNNMIGLPKKKIWRLGASENFWQMGETGPCGPCTEIHMDRGDDPNCPNKANCSPACNCDRFIEIWNLVFMQFDRQPDGTDTPLKQTGVDTGMGLERLCVVVQKKDSVFEIDIFQTIIKRIEKLTGQTYKNQSIELKSAFHVLADHIRASSFIIADGGSPSNEGRGYVLRKIIRRAALFARKLTDKNIFPALSKAVIEDMGDIYPELKLQAKLIYKILESEIQKFSSNLVRGQHILKKYFDANKETKIITGKQAFKLYDTYGFPMELIDIMACEKGFAVDKTGFEKEMKRQQEQSKQIIEHVHIKLPQSISTEFTGYQELETPSEISALIKDDKKVDFVAAGQECYVIAKKSPFFIIGGGQVPDSGWLQLGKQRTAISDIRFIGNAIAAKIVTPIDLKIGDQVTSIVDKELRRNAMYNHTATHMLQAALIKVLGPTVKQSGSLVSPDYLRFDFSYHENLTPEIIRKVENIVNEKIRENIPLHIEYTTLKDALKHGALAFFGDKYKPEKVRMVEISDFSVELCGGTHCPSTGVIGAFKITEVTALSAGHRRIFAVSGPAAIQLFQESYDAIKKLSQDFKVKREDVVTAIEKLKQHAHELQLHVKKLKKEAWKAHLATWEQQVKIVATIPFLFLVLEDFAPEDLREIASHLASKKPGFYFLLNKTGERAMFLCSLSPEFSDTINLKNFGIWLKDKHGLRGGGTKNIIQGGGVKFDANLEESIKSWLTEI